MKIIFYDGNCGLCQRSIQFLWRIDRRKAICFAPLNGVTYKKIYGEELDKLTTVKFYDGSKTYEKSSAILESLWWIGGIYRAIYVFKIIPKFVRDYIYDQIASKRHLTNCILLVKDDRFLL